MGLVGGLFAIRLTPLRIVIAVMLGVFAGTGIFTFWYAKGFSYLSNDPKACANCHIMNDNYKTWQVGSHRSVTCNDCHVPHSFVRKYISKGLNGYHHSFAFTFGPPEVICIKKGNSDILNENCITCHEKMVSHLQVVGDPSRRCTDCHKWVGHGM
jgi:cytochrome c nitrite reductase small subunit